MKHIRKRRGKWLVIDLNKNLVEKFDTETQAEMYQVFEGTIEEFWGDSHEGNFQEEEDSIALLVLGDEGPEPVVFSDDEFRL